MKAESQNVRDFYENGGEADRLERGLGIVEGFRTKELLTRFLQPSMDIGDIGGGAGYYADWLAGLGHRVTMVELAEKAVEIAKASQTSPYTALVGDARHLPLPDASNWENLLALVRLTEQEPSLLGLSPHFLAVAQKA